MSRGRGESDRGQDPPGSYRSLRRLLATHFPQLLRATSHTERFLSESVPRRELAPKPSFESTSPSPLTQTLY